MKRRVLSAGTLKGTRIINPDGKNLGDIKEIMLDVTAGSVVYAVLSFGGILGIGDKYFAIPWNALEINEENKRFILNIPEEELRESDMAMTYIGKEKVKFINKNNFSIL